ncbi:unnamed protein product [Zymoseptoria tritici ST99CH_3D1]|uniref:Uncharacterized protein n=2 Tax=Zymoseptoria tritici TaxID=1047171 RepID=A0A1X7S1U1_ZYMT9|nr:unnamed protein product [Zymoseptoria tritici ST99CH_3D7]SMR57228.1 unnamed protein product [Zymoseptoria tritici ST99CH_1E4]SMR60101.1 unnamed protein product [Zymoseptoria tritici ST99CH_3D1]
MADCHFWKLPLELRNEVYDLVYGRDLTIEPQKTAVPLELKMSSCKFNAVKQTPEHIRRENVGEVRLVSKQFYAETMQRLAQTNTFVLYRSFWGLFPVCFKKFASNVRKLVLEWRDYMARSEMDLNRLCPKLRSLTLSLSADLDEDRVLVLKHAPTEAAVRKSNIVIALSKVRGLRHFAIEQSSASRSALSSAPRWIKNSRVVGMQERIDLLEEVLRSIVTREKIEDKLEVKAAKKGRKAKAV